MKKIETGCEVVFASGLEISFCQETEAFPQAGLEHSLHLNLQKDLK